MFYDWTVVLPIIAVAAPVLLILLHFFVKTINQAAVKRLREVPPTADPALFKDDVTEQAENQ